MLYAAEAQHCKITSYDPPGAASLDVFLEHMLRPGDFEWELHNQKLKQLLRTPHNAAARVHLCVTVAEGDSAPPSPCLDRDFMASLHLVNGTLECPAQEDAHPYWDRPGGFSRNLQGALFPPLIIGHTTMTVWEAHIVGPERTHKRSRWCAVTGSSETPAEGYTAVWMDGWRPRSQPRPTTIQGAGPERP